MARSGGSPSACLGGDPAVQLGEVDEVDLDAGPFGEAVELVPERTEASRRRVRSHSIVTRVPASGGKGLDEPARWGLTGVIGSAAMFGGNVAGSAGQSSGPRYRRHSAGVRSRRILDRVAFASWVTGRSKTPRVPERPGDDRGRAVVDRVRRRRPPASPSAAPRPSPTARVHLARRSSCTAWRARRALRSGSTPRLESDELVSAASRASIAQSLRLAGPADGDRREPAATSTAAVSTATRARRRTTERRSRARSRSRPLGLLAELLVVLVRGGGQVVLLRPGQGELARRRPRRELLQPASSGQQARVPARGLPIRGHDGEPAMLEQIVPRVVDPDPQTIPRPEQRLVRHLDGRSSRGRDPDRTRGGDAGRTCRSRARSPGDRAGARAAPSAGRGAACPRRLRRRSRAAGTPASSAAPLLPIQPVEQLLGATGQRARDAADLPVRLEGHRVGSSRLEQLRQRVLEERKRPRSLGHVRDHLRHERELRHDPDPRRRAVDRRSSSSGVSGTTVAVRVRISSASSGTASGRSKKSARSVTITRSRASGPCVAATRLRRNRFRSCSSSTIVKTSSSWSTTRTSSVPSSGRIRPTTWASPSSLRLERLQQVRRGIDRDVLQRRLELLERMRPREHLDVEPPRPIRAAPGAERRDQARAHRRGLAAPRRAHDGEEPRSFDRLGQRATRASIKRVAAEEVVRVGLDERVESLVRIAFLAPLGRGPWSLGGPRASRSARASSSASRYRSFGSSAVARPITPATRGRRPGRSPGPARSSRARRCRRSG